MIYTKSVYIACIYTLHIQLIQNSNTGVYVHIYSFVRISCSYIQIEKVFSSKQMLTKKTNGISKLLFI